MVSDLEPPLPNLETLLQRAQGPHQQGTRLFILSAIVSRELSAGDILAAVRSIDRLLMLAAAHERTLPLAGLAPVMAMTQVAISTGALEDAVRLRESIARLEPLLPALLPEPAGAYLAAVADLRTRVTEQRYAELAAEVTGRSITQANRLATAIVRAFLVKNAPSKRRGPPSAKALTRPTGLTPREAEVLGQLARGGTNRDVAATLGITPKTVMHHTMAIYRKLGVRGRAEATAWAFRHGLVEHD